MTAPPPAAAFGRPSGRPRVCLLSQLVDESRGGPARHTVQLARELDRLGLDVLILARRIGGVAAPDLPPGCRVVQVPAPFPNRVNLEDATPGNLLVSLGYTLGAAAVLVRERRSLAVVHAQGASLPTALLAPLVRRLGLRLVARPLATGQGVEAGDLAGRYWGIGDLLVRCLRGTRFVAISSRIEAALRREGHPDVRRIPLSVATDRFRPPADAAERGALRERLGYCGRTVLFVGRLVERKRPLLLLDCLAAARERAPDLRLEVLGDGPLMPAVRARVAALGLGDAVSLPGFVADTPERLRAADGFVLCSTIEGLPNAMLEAMASGLPCLATRISGTEDALTDGETGLLVDPHDPTALTAGLVRLGTEDLTALGAAARAAILAGYTPATLAARWVEAYGLSAASER